jgi:hypothetical protein
MSTAEMFAASAQVIAHRTSKPATPAQLFVMGSEKVVAAMQSSNAMTRHLLTRRTSAPEDFWTAYLRLLSVGISPVRARAVSNARRYSRR